MNNFKNIETRIFAPSLLIMMAVIFIMMYMPDKARTVIDLLFSYMTNQLGWMYLLIINVVLIFSLWMAFSKYGQIKLGEKDEKMEYSTFAWVAMMFTAGIGVGVVFLSFIEPLSFLSAPPFGMEPFSDLAYEYAHMYDQFLWGISGWALYAPATIAIAYTLYVKKDSVLRMSNACKPVLGARTNGLTGTVIDVLVMLGIIGGVSTSLGMGVPLVTTLIEHLTGIPQGSWMTFGVVILWTLIFGTSVFLGLDKGIKNLSRFNLYLLGILILAVIAISPMQELMNLEMNSLGRLIDNFAMLSFGTDPIAKGGFPQGWTIFYWAWWLAFMPMMGLFIARISRGRTIRQVILGQIIWGGGGCLSCFGLFGGYALYLQKSGAVDLIATLQTLGREQTVITLLQTLPLSQIMIVLYLIMILVFLATTIDSTVYVLSSVCTVRLSGNEQPAKWNRILWAIILMLITLGLVFIGGLQAVQTASIVVGFPLIFVTIIIMVSVKRMLEGHEQNAVHDSQHERNITAA